MLRTSRQSASLHIAFFLDGAIAALLLALVSTSSTAAELVEYSPAERTGVGNCPLLYPSTATLSTAFRDGLTTSCYSCPKGTVRNVTPISSDDACIEVDLEPSYSSATFETAGSVPGAFWDPRNGGEWWKCPAGYPRRTLYAVTDDRACATSTLWPDEHLSGATFLGNVNNYPPRPASAFWDPRNGGEWWSCPDNYVRTLAPVDKANACRDTPSVRPARATLRGPRGCAGNSFSNGLSGECYRCPSGYSRSLAIGDDLTQLDTACVKVDVAGFADEQIRQRLLAAIAAMNLPSAAADVESTYSGVVQFLETNADAVAEIVSKNTSESRRKQLVSGLKTYFDAMGRDLVQWTPKSASLGFAGDASYGVGVAATDPMVVWKLESDLTSASDWGLYWAANGTLGASVGASVTAEIGLWTDDPPQLAGPAFGVVFGGSVKAGISVTYWWALQPGDPKFIGATITPGFGVEAEAEMIAGYTVSYTEGFSSGNAPPASQAEIPQQPPTGAEQVPAAEMGDAVPDGGLFLASDWMNYGGPFAPAHIDKAPDGRVTLSGLIDKGSFDNVIGVLWEGYRPSEQLVFNANHHDSVMRVDVLPNGHVRFVAGSKTYGWVDLTGIRFDTSRSGYRDLPLANGWAAYGRGFGRPQYKVDDTWTTLSGLVRLPGSYLKPIATLPPEARPGQRLIFSANAHENAVRVDVLPNGQVLFVAGVSAHGWISLEGIQFVRARTRAHAEKREIRGGWPAYGKDYAPPYMVKVGKTVELGGLAKEGNGDVIGKLPREYWPANTLIFNVNNHGKSARVDVRPTGDVVWVAGGKDPGWISLSGILYETP